MDKQRIIDYVMQSPQNSNPAVLGSLLDQYSSGSAPIERTILFPKQKIRTVLNPSSQILPEMPQCLIFFDDKKIAPSYWHLYMDGIEVPDSGWRENAGREDSTDFVWMDEDRTKGGILTFNGFLIGSTEEKEWEVEIVAEPFYPSGTYTITESGSHYAPTKTYIYVDMIQPSGAIAITENGEVDVSSVAYADVNVPPPTQDMINVHLTFSYSSSLQEPVSFSITYDGIDDNGKLTKYTVSKTAYPDISPSFNLNIYNGSAIIIPEGFDITSIQNLTTQYASAYQVFNADINTIEGVYIKKFTNTPSTQSILVQLQVVESID